MLKSKAAEIVWSILERLLFIERGDFSPKTKLSYLEPDYQGRLEVLMEIQTELGIVISDEEEEEISTVDDLIACVVGKKSVRQTGAIGHGGTFD